MVPYLQNAIMTGNRLEPTFVVVRSENHIAEILRVRSFWGQKVFSATKFTEKELLVAIFIVPHLY